VDRRRQIRMSEAELVEFLDSRRMVTCAAIAPQAAKRVGIRFHPTRVSSWDHRKLG
jgi:hypothetical protein